MSKMCYDGQNIIIREIIMMAIIKKNFARENIAGETITRGNNEIIRKLCRYYC